MRQLVYVMHFRGQASPSADNDKVLRITSSGTSSTMETTVGAQGVDMVHHAAPGDLAFLEAEIHMTTPDSLNGSGVLTFGDEGEHELKLDSMHYGHLRRTSLSGLMAGSVSWQVSGSKGRFAGASGVITSTFTLSDAGELNEYQCGLVFLATDT